MSIRCISIFLFSCLLANVLCQNTDFSGISWSRDYGNNPVTEEYGCGHTDSPSTSSSAVFLFTLTGCTSGTQRQEFKYERRTGIHAMVGTFRFSNAAFTDDGGISIAQTHDDRTGSDGVFSIYRLHYRSWNRQYYLMPQTDETNYPDFRWVGISPNTDYYMDIQTWSAGSSSFERARIWKGTSHHGQLLGTWIINDGSGDDSEQYKKIGAYALTNTYGSIRVEWTGVKMYTGTW